MENIIKRTALPGVAISVIRTKGGSNEELTMNRICSHLVKSNIRFLIFSLNQNNCYNPRKHGGDLLELEKKELLSEDLYIIPYKRVLKINDAKQLTGSYIIADWSIWNRNFIEALNKTLPGYVLLFTVGEDQGASDYVMRTALELSSGVFLTMSDKDHYSLSQIKWYVDNLNDNDLEKIYVSSWTIKKNKEFNKIFRASEFIDNPPI